MFNRAIILLLTLMMVPSFASAKTYWAITKTISPIAVSKAVVTAARPANFGNYTTPGGANFAVTNVTNSTNGLISGAYSPVGFDVTVPAGYTLTNVKVDGVIVGTTAGTYNVNKGTTLSHNIVVTYAAAGSTSYTITTQPAAGGSISPSRTYTTPADISRNAFRRLLGYRRHSQTAPRMLWALACRPA